MLIVVVLAVMLPSSSLSGCVNAFSVLRPHPAPKKGGGGVLFFQTPPPPPPPGRTLQVSNPDSSPTLYPAEIPISGLAMGITTDQLNTKSSATGARSTALRAQTKEPASSSDGNSQQNPKSNTTENNNTNNNSKRKSIMRTMKTKTTLTSTTNNIAATKGNVVNTTTSTRLGVVDPEAAALIYSAGGSHVSIALLDDGNGNGKSDPCDCMLVLIDPAKNMDKFYILQLISCVPNSTQSSTDEPSSSFQQHGYYYIVYSRWGHTGTTGRTLQRVFDHFDDAAKEFKSMFRRKTGLSWNNQRDHPTVGGKYRIVQQNFSMKQQLQTSTCPCTTNKWQYWVDDGIDDKANGWYDYTVDGSRVVEQLYQEHLLNSGLSKRTVRSGKWKYNVDLERMVQTNVQHPNKTSRRIRRFTEDG